MKQQSNKSHSSLKQSFISKLTMGDECPTSLDMSADEQSGKESDNFTLRDISQ